GHRAHLLSRRRAEPVVRVATLALGVRELRTRRATHHGVGARGLTAASSSASRGLPIVRAYELNAARMSGGGAKPGDSLRHCSSNASAAPCLRSCTSPIKNGCASSTACWGFSQPSILLNTHW